MDEVMTVEEAAKFMKVGRATVLNWVRSGKLPAFREGTVRIKKSDLDSRFVRNKNEDFKKSHISER